jgi:predicted Zn-dependent protease
MPLIALGSLSLAVTVPVLSATTIHAAAPVRYATVVVQPGDNLWSLAAARTAKDADVQAIVDEIVAANRLASGGLQPGQRIRIPQEFPGPRNDMAPDK